MNVVVVESPAKAKTIEKYLGKDFVVLASYGHVRDLPAKEGSVRPNEDFAMTYRTDPRAAKRLKEIANALKGSKNLYLATDPDREGEAISWHVLEALAEMKATEGVEVHRVVFHEITKSAVTDAVANPRDMDMNLVNAQQARRALDYLVGFTLSPVLWRKLPGSKSAGRVQSVALRLVCERELEIEAFDPQEYWTVEADFQTAGGQPLTAKLINLKGEKLSKFTLGNEASALAAVQVLENAGGFSVAELEKKETRRHPPPPFTTSTLQQDASRKLRFANKRTMDIAQRLYEGMDVGGGAAGLITYMRTDGVQMAGEAVNGCRTMVASEFGDAYVPEEPRVYKSTARNAQEAHEAIRPTDFSRTPALVKGHMNDDEFRLYELIWKRATASQVASARLEQAGLNINTNAGDAVLRATGQIVLFDGFLRLYQESRDDAPKSDAASADRDDERRLPAVAKGDVMTRSEIRPEQHFTEPPPRFSEATLVKRMEELGIGRPSTYASILSVLQDRNYVRLEKRRFAPEDRGRLVTAFLSNFFERYVEYDFTADLEAQLDRISAGEIEWKAVLQEFWTTFYKAIDDTKELRVRDVLDVLNKVLGAYFFQSDDPNVDPMDCPKCADGRLSLKLGKFGAFVGCSNYPDCKFTRPLVATGDGTAADNEPKELGKNAASGLVVSRRQGPYGPYVQLGDTEGGEKPKRVSIPKGTDPEDITFEIAVALLALPRDMGEHPETGKMIQAGIGRYGPYVKHAGVFVSLTPEDDVLSVGLNRAIALLADAKNKPGRGGAATTLKDLGAHPVDGKPITVRSGRYGPYVKHLKTNATLLKGTEPEDLSLEDAVALLDAKIAKTGKGKPVKPKKKLKAKANPKAKAKPKTKPAASDPDPQPSAD
jgi:DNA topoisomerase-1